MAPQQLNVEYWFRLLYECLHGACYGNGVDTSQLSAAIAHLWLWVVAIGYGISAVSLVGIAYATIELFELRKREEEFYHTLIVPAEEDQTASARWRHVESLRDSSAPNDWRSAILEADIMLDDALTKQGYAGETVADKLKSADPHRLATLQQAWDAHRVRNQIAHEGSTFDLTEQLARRTIAQYESVLHELKVL
jgi:hypothetical protein